MEGRLVLTASRDNTVRVWDSRTGEPVTPPLEHRSLVQQARLSGDGSRLLSQSHSDIHVWEFAPARWPEDDLVAWSKILACQQIDAAGNMVSLDAPRTPRVPPGYQIPGAYAAAIARLRDALRLRFEAPEESNGFDPAWKAIRDRYPQLFENRAQVAPVASRPKDDKARAAKTAQALHEEGQKLLETKVPAQALERFHEERQICFQEGDLNRAHAALLASLKALAEIAGAAPKDSNTRRTLWQEHLRLAQEALHLGDAKTGLSEAAKASTWLGEYESLASVDATAAELLIQGYHDLGLTALDLKDLTLARKTLQRGTGLATSVVNKRPTPERHYSLACLCSLLAACSPEEETPQNQTRAIEELEAALKLDSFYCIQAERDEDLGAIRSHPRYKMLLEQARKAGNKMLLEQARKPRR
jgi:tetratricopeptide (TPR) repeat protein